MKNQNTTTQNGTAPTPAAPYTAGQVLASLAEMDKQLESWPISLVDGPGWVRGIARDITARGIAADAELLAALESIANGCTTDTGEHRLGTVNLDRDAMQAVARAAIARATAGGNGGAK